MTLAGRRPRRRYRPGVLAVVAAAVSLCSITGATTTSADTPVPSSTLAPGLGLVGHRFNVEANGFVDMVLALPGALDAGTLAATFPDTAVVVTAYRPLTERAGVQEALEGTLPRSVDTVDLGLLSLPQPEPQQLQLTVAVEVETRTPTALQLPEPGLYPITVELRGGGDVLAELTTFVHRVPSDDEPVLRSLPLAFAMSTTANVVLDDDNDVVLDDVVLDELKELAEVLEASAVPVGVRLPPALLAALADGDTRARDIGDRLQAVLGAPVGHEVLSAPALPIDPSAAAAANAGDVYGDWLRDGEDVMADLGTSPRRSVTVVDQPLSQEGADLLRTLGSRLLVVPVEWYDLLPDSFGGFTDSSLLVALDLGDNTTMSAAVVDRGLDDVLARPTSTPLRTAVEVVAELLAARQQIVESGDDPRRHGITLATPDLSLPEAGTMAAVTTLLAATPGLEATTLDELSVRVDRLRYQGDEVVVGLPDTVPVVDLAPRLQLATDLALEATSTGSMLPSTDPRLATWTTLIDTVITSAITDDQAAAIADSLRTEFRDVRSTVLLPEGFSFTLTGRRGEVPVTLQNTGDTTITVVVRMSSPKLLFPEGDTVVELPPGEFREVRIPIEARSNGKFPVTLEVVTPVGGVRLGPQVPLTARVTALAGLGPLITGAAALVVVAWWMRHVRTSRRKRAAGSAVDRHPSATASIDDAGLSPDAAASTLPNS